MQTALRRIVSAPNTMLSAAASAIGVLLLVVIAVYRAVVSPVLHALAGGGGGCGYLPTCSEYARASIRLNGPLRGGLQSLRRILRCHPFHVGGFDPPTRVR